MTVAYNPQEDLIRLAKIKAAQDELAREKGEVETRLLADLVSRGVKTISAQVDGADLSGTVVQPERTTIDADGLEHDLTKRQWERVSSRVLDKELLEAAVAQGIVDISVVHKHSETKPTKGYVKVSGKVPTVPLLDGVTFSQGHVSITASNGTTKPAARKRVAKPRAGK